MNANNGFADWVRDVTDAPTCAAVNREVGSSLIHLTHLEDGDYYAEWVWRLTSAARARLIELDDQFNAREDARKEMAQ